MSTKADAMAWTFLPFNDWIAATVPSGVIISISTISARSLRPLTPPAALISSMPTVKPLSQSL